MRLTYPQLARGLLLALALFAGRWCQDLERIKVPVPSCGPSSTLWTGGACAVYPISWYSILLLHPEGVMARSNTPHQCIPNKS